MLPACMRERCVCLWTEPEDTERTLRTATAKVNSPPFLIFSQLGE